MAFGISEAQILGLWLETLFLGVNLVSFGFAVHAFLFNARGGTRRPAKDINWFLFFMCIFLCFTSIFDTGVGLAHNIDAFIKYKGPGGSDEHFHNISNWVNVAKSVTGLLQPILGDGILIYRCWIVYSKSWKIICGPMLLYLADIGFAICVLYYESTLRSQTLLNTSLIVPVLSGFYGATIVLNLLTTGLIIFRIWKAERIRALYIFSYSSGPSSSSSQSPLSRVMRIIIESGLLITLTSVVVTITYATGSNAVYPTSDVLVQNVAIAFNLIIIRSRHKSGTDSTTPSGTVLGPNANSTPLFPLSNHARHPRTSASVVSEDPPIPFSSSDSPKPEGLTLGRGQTYSLHTIA